MNTNKNKHIVLICLAFISAILIFLPFTVLHFGASGFKINLLFSRLFKAYFDLSQTILKLEDISISTIIALVIFLSIPISIILKNRFYHLLVLIAYSLCSLSSLYFYSPVNISAFTLIFVAYITPLGISYSISTVRSGKELLFANIQIVIVLILSLNYLVLSGFYLLQGI